MNGFEVYKIYLAIKLHFTSKTNLMTFISTTVEQLQDWKHLLKEGIGISFISFLNLITITALLITSLVILFLILIYGLVTLLASLVMIIIKNGQKN